LAQLKGKKRTKKNLGWTKENARGEKCKGRRGGLFHGAFEVNRGIATGEKLHWEEECRAAEVPDPLSGGRIGGEGEKRNGLRAEVVKERGPVRV